jgi:hypothetical protein
MTYTIDYNMFFIDGSYSHPSPMKIRNCMSELQAKIRLEDYLMRHNRNFSRLVILSCKEPLAGGVFDFLGKDNPFS